MELIKVVEMIRRSGAMIVPTILLVFLFCGTLWAQNARGQIRANTASANSCELNGVYRINIARSDKLYSVVEGATSKVPFRDQQRFFMDLSVRLTPPDILAIECRGSRVSVGSSRASRVTFVANGKTRSDRTADGYVVNSRIELKNNTLTFTSSGKTEDNVSVTFTSIEDGKGLHVKRHIYSEQLTEPIVIQTVYNKISDSARWDTFGDEQIARQSPRQNDDVASSSNASVSQTAGAERNEANTLRRSLDRWIEVTNARDIETQMSFYMPELKAFYLARNTPISSVRAEKNRVLGAARSIDIRAEEPEIIFQEAGRTAIMRFRKKYRVEDKSRSRSGEVVQELRWRQTNNGWRIFSERDIRVIR